MTSKMSPFPSNQHPNIVNLLLVLFNYNVFVNFRNNINFYITMLIICDFFSKEYLMNEYNDFL